MGKLSKAQEAAVRWFVEALRKDIGQAANPPVNGRTLACLERDGYVVRVWTSARGEGWQATNKATVWVEDQEYFAAKQRRDEWDEAERAAVEAAQLRERDAAEVTQAMLSMVPAGHPALEGGTPPTYPWGSGEAAVTPWRASHGKRKRTHARARRMRAGA